MRIDTGARGTVNARDKGALAVYAEVKAELAEAATRRRAARASLTWAARVAAFDGVSELSAVAAVVAAYEQAREDGRNV